MSLPSRPPLEGRLGEFAKHYCQVIDRFAEVSPLLVKDRDRRREIREAAEEYATGVRILVRHAVRHGDPESEAPSNLWRALFRAYSILEYLESGHILGQESIGEFSDREYVRLARQVTSDELARLIDILGAPDPNPVEGDLPPGLVFEISGEEPPSDEEKKNGKLRRLLRGIASFKDKGAGRLVQEFKGISIPLLLQLLNLLQVELPEGLPNELLLELIDQGIEGGRALGIGLGSGTCKIEVELEKVDISSGDLGTDGWYLTFVIAGDTVRVPQNGYLDLNAEHEKEFSPPTQLAKFEKKGCGTHEIYVHLEARETEYGGDTDFDEVDRPFEVPCGGAVQSETISVRVSENEGTEDVDVNTTVTVTAHLLIESQCVR